VAGFVFISWERHWDKPTATFSSTSVEMNEAHSRISVMCLLGGLTVTKLARTLIESTFSWPSWFVGADDKDKLKYWISYLITFESAHCCQQRIEMIKSPKVSVYLSSC
jgi:hypothetical protein